MGHSWSPLRKLSEWPQASGPGPQDTSGRRPWHPHRAHDTSPPARRSWSRICLGSLDLDGDGTNAGDSIESAGRAHSQPRGFHLQRRKAGILAGLPDWEGTQAREGKHKIALWGLIDLADSYGQPEGNGESCGGQEQTQTERTKPFPEDQWVEGVEVVSDKCKLQLKDPECPLSLDSLVRMYSGINSELRPCHKDSFAMPCAKNRYMLFSCRMAQNDQSGLAYFKPRVPAKTPAPMNLITFASSMNCRSRSEMPYPER
uniref:Uncharacterized protein n=1 Tax=Oryza nivara TaxID=4536 RepID=A0A0E0IYR8_ORYNI